jgi:hypothetical protein
MMNWNNDNDNDSDVDMNGIVVDDNYHNEINVYIYKDNTV